MSLNKVTVTLEPRGSDVSKNRVVTNWHVETVDDTAPTRVIVVTAFENFFQTIRDWLGPSLVGSNTPAHMVRMYVVDPNLPDEDLPEGESDDTIGSPVATNLFALESTGASPLPAQVAARISLNASLTGIQIELEDGTRPQAQRRGGPYIAPLAAVCGEANTDGFWVFKETFRQSITDAVLALQDELLPAAALHVYSPTGGLARPVIRAEMDNSPDVIRSRKIKATASTAVTIPTS